MEAIKACSHIIEDLEDGLLVIDTHGRIKYANPACIKILDVKDNESIFETFQEDSELVKLFIEVKDKGTSIKDRDIEISKPQRRKNLLRAVVHPLKDDGENTQVAFVLKDLKKIRGLEMSIERTSRLTTMGNLASTVAHEMKNPLVIPGTPYLIIVLFGAWLLFF